MPCSQRHCASAPRLMLAAWCCAFLVSMPWSQHVRCQGDRPAPRPRIHIYQVPTRLTLEETSEAGLHPGNELQDRLCRSDYFEPDPAKADYFWVPGSGRFRSKEKMLEVLSHIKTEYPWWNQTVARGEARHLMVATRDADPGLSWGWPLTNTSYPPDINPASLTRNLVFLTFNGMVDGPQTGKKECTICFIPGKDIVIPKFQGICNGPLCGFNLTTLRAKSIWALPPDQLQAEYKRRRKKLLFFGGSTMHNFDFTGRGGLAMFYSQYKRYLIQTSKGTKKQAQVSFPDAMLNSEFCFSPLGGNGGPTDRYVSGSMFGCIPVMLNTTHDWRHRTMHALPYEEILPWHEFATVIDNWDMATLDRQLQCLMPRLPQMRAALSKVWPSLVWSSIYGSFLNEGVGGDAFETLMALLRQRMQHGFKPPPHVLERFSRPGTLFPCRRDSPVEQGGVQMPFALLRTRSS